MKAITCIRCDREVRMSDDAIPELTYHRCIPQTRPSRSWWHSYSGTTSEEAQEAVRRAAREALGEHPPTSDATPQETVDQDTSESDNETEGERTDDADDSEEASA